MAWEIKGTTGSLETFPHISYQSKVSAPKNPKLIKEIKKPQKWKPSDFLKEMSMDTKQKLASTHEMYLPRIIELLDMGETSLQKNTQLMIDEPMFQPYPSEIYFQKYEPFTTYEVPLLLRNNDKVPRLVKVTQLDTPYFKIITSADAHHKVGPGLPIIYRIQFLPEENRDYNHELIVTTEREKFIIPIKCIGARAILDFPDEINFSLCPVKNLNSKVLLIRNVGNRDARFSLKTEKPFTVNPEHGILPIGENMQVTVDFQPLKCGDYKRELAINYDSGETLYVNLFGAAQDINVRLDKNSIRIEDTYITMSNQRTVTIHNRGDVIVHFEWKKYATLEEEEHQKLKEIGNLTRDEENAKNKLATQNPDHMALLSRNFKNKIRTTQNKPLHFDDTVFYIQPIEGDIWPNSSTEVTVIFKPDYAQTYNKTAFCEITGRESRLPLRLCGVGAGPKIQLSIEVLDVGSIFIGSTHVYEIVMSNKGYIDAIYTINIPNTQFGKCFQFEPNESLISPGGYQAINVVFLANKLGDFDETFDIMIDGKPEKYKLVIKGSVIPPTFSFDVPKIKFGLVSYGFKYSHNCILSNTSLVPMSFNMRVASDDEARDLSSMSYGAVVSDSPKETGENSTRDLNDYNFKEFSITPSTGIIQPQSDIKVLVEFVPHFIKKYETVLVVDVEDVGLELFNLPISARSTVPNVTILSPQIDLGRCFIYYPYESYIKLSNQTTLKARYTLLPSKVHDSIKFQSNLAEGIIEPNSIKEIPVFAEALELGDIESDLLIKINGSVEQPLTCHYICFSQGPVVQIQPKSIDWGLTTVLVDSSRELTLSNESLIDANYTTSMGKRSSAWRVEPPSGLIPAGSEITVKAVCHLIDKTKYEDTINIEIENSHTQKINVKASGSGSSIVSEPPIGNLVDFGTFFSGGQVRKVFKLTNKSSRQQNLSFQPDQQKANLVTAPNKKDQVREKSKINQTTLFKVIPTRVELASGETKEIVIEGFGEKPQLIEEMISCYSIIGRTTGKDRVMKFKIKCEFIAPLMSFSTKDLVFRCEHDGNGLPANQTRQLTISNISILDLTAQLSTSSPFSLVDDETGNLMSELLISLKTGESVHLTCLFDTSFKHDLHNQVVNGHLNISYAEHQETDLVNLIGEIYFPNIYLESTFIDFGCILNNTEVKQKVKMTNIGPLIVNYKWKFLVDKDNIILPNLTLAQQGASNETSCRSSIQEPAAVQVKNSPQEQRQHSPVGAETDEISKQKSELLFNETIAEETTAGEQATEPATTTGDEPKNKLEELLVRNNSLVELPSIEEIFDISPLYGNLHPGETQDLIITYYGHKEIRAHVKAVCEIKNGPCYEMTIKGEASVLNYEVSTKHIDFGCIPYDEISEAQLKIKNLGKVSIKYSMVEKGADSSESTTIEPDRPIIIPASGLIGADQTQTITIRYLPGVPKIFSKTFLIQISHFAPEEITLHGEAGFADLMLDLPRFQDGSYEILKKEALVSIDARCKTAEMMTPELELQLEIDRLSIQNFIKDMSTNLVGSNMNHLAMSSSQHLREQSITVKPSMGRVKSVNKISQIEPVDVEQHFKYTHSQIEEISSYNNINNNRTAVNYESTESNRTNESSKGSLRKRPKAALPDYMLDFGHVILGTVKTHVIRATNLGKIAASFEIERQNFAKTGFLIDLEKVKNLPNEETVEFVVTFDPRGANLGLGPVDHVIPLNIINGPTVNIRLKANVTMPDLQISDDCVEFKEVKCGECKIITVQLNNHKEVRCDWFASYLPKKDEKFTPMHLKRKKKVEGEQNKPRIFEIMPPSGILMPGQKANIQIKFMPTEEKYYEERVTIRMSQSSQRLMILCKGKGLEPRIELSKNSIEFEPILPHSAGDEQEVKIYNPCSFPIEIYNLEFDKIYLEEEKVLRIIRGYDEYNTILLPPRNAGEKLPLELYDYYDEQLKKLDEEERKQKAKALNELTNNTEISEMTKQTEPTAETDKSKSKSDDISGGGTGSKLQVGVGDVEKNPVCDSIARYLGIDLSAEGRAARNRRGVAMVVHGPPLSGKSRAAVALARYYECALLTLDTIVIEAMSNSTSPAASRARQMCAEAASKHAEEIRAQEIVEASRMNLNTAGQQSNLAAQASTVGTTAAGLSVEALAQHTTTQGGILAGSKKTSVAGDSHSNVKSKKIKADNSNADQSSNHPSSPQPLQGPIARKLSISTNLYSQDAEGYMSTVLPEDVIVEILNERFQLSDCNRGLIIDGLDTLFCQNYLLAATAILKAFNNRRYIYFITMKSDYQKYKEQLNKIQEEKLKAKKEKELQDQLFLEEMDEETYNNLPFEKRKEIDNKLQETKKLRLKKEAEERAEKERIERELAEQQARIEEEKKKKKKTGPTKGGADNDKKSIAPTQSGSHPTKAGGKENLKESKDKAATGGAVSGSTGTAPVGNSQSLHHPQNAVGQSGDRPHTRIDAGAVTNTTSTINETDSDKAKKLGTKLVPHEEEPVKDKVIDPEEEKRKEVERLLQQRFKTFDVHFKDICSLLDAWDRTQGSIFRQPSPSDKSELEDHLAARRNRNAAKNKKEKAAEAAEKLKAEQQKLQQQQQQQSQQQPQQSEDTEKEENTETSPSATNQPQAQQQQQSTQQQSSSQSNEDSKESIGVPHIVVENMNKFELDEIYKHPKFPPIEDVLDGMGLGPKGPPIPPAALFAVVPYPTHRKSPPGAEFSHYIFVSTNDNDPNLIPDERYKDSNTIYENPIEGEKTPEQQSKVSSKSKASKNTGRSESKADVGRRTSGVEKKRAESRLKKEQAGGGATSPNRGSSSMSGHGKGEDNLDGTASMDGSGMDKPSQKLVKFRWILGANSEITIRLRFTSEEVGQFDQTLNFEIVGTRRRYQLHSRGVCTFPTISREPRVVFPNRKKTREPNEIIHKKYILSEDMFEFGPLLYGNNRERCREGKFPDYMETLSILNVSPLDAEVSFCFLEDTNDKTDSCFFLEPSEFSLKPHEAKMLKIYATPKEPRQYIDTLVCCVKENPEPITFKISCHGQKPELTLDKKEFNFKQVLLHRKDSKNIKMTNNTMLNVLWRLDGTDGLSEEFVCNQTSGIIEPNESFDLVMHFRALRPITIGGGKNEGKKVFRLFVSSLNSHLGFMENHVISLTAEAYDVALEITLPKGNDGGLDFGNIRIGAGNENKHTCMLRNKGKYPIKFNFITEPTGPETVEAAKCLSVVPVSGELAGDRNSQNTNVNVIVNVKKELSVRDAPILKCQIIDPSASDNPVIANIPMRVSFKSSYSKFNIVPHSEINFGCMLVNSKRQDRFIIENKGDFEFKVNILKYDSTKNQPKDGGQNQGRAQFGIYTITPSFGLILPNGHVVFTVDCAPESAGKYDEELTLEITDRNMNEYPNGIIYKLSAEAVYPAISNSVEMFEEHTIIPNTSVLDAKMMGVGIYAEEENKFFFNNVIVGRTAKARFKLLNTNKIPIDLSLTLKSSNKMGSKTVIDSIFELEPQRVHIAAHSFAYATVSFTPTSISSYATILEAMLENIPTSLKNRTVSFEINGEGNLPRFNILKPVLRNKKGQTLMLFKRCVINHSDSQLLVLNNDGSLPVKVNFFFYDPDSAFKIKPASKNNLEGLVLKDNEPNSVSSAIIQPNGQVSFQVTCLPRAIQTYQASLQITVTDNQFEDTLIQMIGEGYMEDVTLENLHSLTAASSTSLNELDEDLLADEDLTALKSNLINFGDVYINEKKQILFTIKNHSKNDCFRFEWPLGVGFSTHANENSPTFAATGAASAVTFSPRVGHLHAGCAKDITVTFKTNEPKLLRKELVNCTLTKITFDQPVNEVKDWDDRMTMVRWVNEIVHANSNNNNNSNVPPTTAQAATTQVNSSHNDASALGTQRIASELGNSTSVSHTQNNNSQLATNTKQIVKKKVIEIEPEPKYMRIDDTVQSIELFVNANCDYCRYRCRTNAIRFKDTLMFQTRVYEVTLINRGKIAFDYNWKTLMEDNRRPFTPLIPPDTPTPDRSLSPPGRLSKTSKGTENSVSPTRRGGNPSMGSTGGKDAAGKGEAKKDAAKGQAGSKKNKDLNADDTIKSTKSGTSGGQGRKSKEVKSSLGDNEDGSSGTTKHSKDNEGGAKAYQYDLNDITARLSEEALINAIQPLRPDSQFQMRAESSLSHHAPSTIIESGYIPFSVEPAFGRLEPGKTQKAKIKFSPLNVNDYQARLVCQIPNTEDGKLGPIIAVRGRGLLPYCHFELEESDYLTSGRRNPELPGPLGAASGLGLDPTTKVIEFNCVGLLTKVVRKFEIINPTNADYDFEWYKEEQNDGRRHNQFTCLQTRGKLLSGRKYELGFEFEPDEIGIKENFWRFKIPKYDLSVPFLLVGNAQEPKVIFDRSHISFKPLLVGRTANETVYLVNQESIAVGYEFDQTSCYTEARSAVCLVEPSSGQLAANSKTPIKLSFQPKEQRSSVFNLKCKLTNSHKPLNLNVKGEGFAIQTSLHCEDTNSGERIEFSDTNMNEIHMGEVEKNEACFRNLYITNGGKHRVNFEWFLTSQFEDALKCFSIEPQCDQIEPGDRKHCILKYHAKLEKSTIANLILKIENGPIYHVHLDGIAVKPDLHLSTSLVDFGACFVYRAGMYAKTNTLTLTNNGLKELNVSCIGEPVNSSGVFQLDFKQVILGPGKSASCTVTFLPKDCRSYSDKIVFELNGLTKREVTLSGVGTQLRLELADPKHKLFDLGTLQIGKVSRKTLQLINRSVIPVEFNLIFEPKSEQLIRDKKLAQIEIDPVQGIQLKPGQTTDVRLKFAPLGRIQRFVEDLNVEYCGITVPLCSIQGACHGYNIWLESSTVPFGAVSQKCSTVKRILMHNDGDIGASFKWETDKMKPEFAIYPTYGYISPGMEVNFDITFNPTELATDIRKENVKCFVEGLEKPLTLNFTGSCVQIVPQKEVHNFETYVRQKDTKQITISNRTNLTWELKPIIEGEFFSGLESLIVEPQSSSTYDVVYEPMSMTSTDGKRHSGSVFFPLPDGTGLLYNLTGVSNPPKPIAKLQREVPCKTNLVEVLTVENWLKKAQRFKVNFEILRPEKSDSSSVIKGHDYIDVPGNGRKEYKLTFFAHKEALTLLKVIFKNEQTNEYSFYEISFKSVKGGSLETIDLITQMRVPVKHSIKFDNPLLNQVNFSPSCTNTVEILMPPTFSVPGKGQNEFTFEYLPLKAGETTARLELASNELGSCIYDLNLKAIAAPAERAIYFKTTLGNSQTITAKFMNFSRQKTDYSTKVDNNDFKVEKSIAAAPSQMPSGIEVSFDITYEPSNMGDTKATLVLSSPLGGDYVFPLHATCLTPKPQGPFVVKSNSNTTITFKNIFSSALAYSFAIDNPLFHVSKQTEIIKPHQTHKIVVGFDGNDSANKADVMAKLVVTAPKSAGSTNHVQWIYYLKGVS